MPTSVYSSQDSIAVCASDKNIITKAMISGAFGVGKWRV
jgi:hypothetical protein